MDRRKVAQTIESGLDPIIPVEDFYTLKIQPPVRIIVHDKGGHNGFVDSFFGPTWHERFMLDVSKI